MIYPDAPPRAHRRRLPRHPGRRPLPLAGGRRRARDRGLGGGARTRSRAASLDGPERDAIRQRLSELYDYPRVSVPQRKGARYFYSRNPGLLNQAVLYVREGLGGAERVLLDPNTLTADGTAALTAAEPSPRRRAAGLRGLAQRQRLAGAPRARRRRPDGTCPTASAGRSSRRSPGRRTTPGFFYIRFPAPGTCPRATRTTSRASTGIAWATRRRRTRSSASARTTSEVVFQTEHHRRRALPRAPRLPGLEPTRARSTCSTSRRRTRGRRCCRSRRASPPRTLFVGDAGGRFYFRTDQDATPLGRVIAVDSARARRSPSRSCPRARTSSSAARIAGRQAGRWSRMVDASDRIDRARARRARAEREIALPTLGTRPGSTGEPGDDEMFLGFTSFTTPPRRYRYDFATGEA